MKKFPWLWSAGFFVLLASVFYLGWYLEFVFNRAFIEANQSALPLRYEVASWFGYGDLKAVVLSIIFGLSPIIVALFFKKR